MKNKKIMAILLSLTMIASLPGINAIAAPTVNTNENVIEITDINEELTTDNNIAEVDSNLGSNTEDSVDNSNQYEEVQVIENNNEEVEVASKVKDIIREAKEVVNINNGWTVTKEGITSDINLPHSWEYTHPTMSFIPAMNMLTVTYEKKLDISKYEDKNLFLKFYGVNKKAVIYVDGVKVDTHIGGFSTFVVDITDYVNGNIANIKVEVTNLDTDTIPINTDFTHWAGIYRDVELVATDDIYISTEDYGTSGVYLDQNVDLKNNKATLNVKTAISHDVETDTNIIVKAEIKDKTGEVVKVVESTYEAKGNKTNSYVSLPQIEIENPHLWNGTDDPYLYTVDVTLVDENERIIDTESQRIGFRKFEVTDEGFLLNGSVYKLKGVGFHQDREGYGNAVSKEHKKEDLEMIREMGANAIRTAHYPHEQYVYDLADEMGLIVWNEIPFYLIMADTDEFRETAKQQLVEMIRQGYNHPSIAFWGIQNEVNTNASYAQFGKQFEVSEETLSEFMKELAALAKSEDSSRFVVQAHINGASKGEESSLWTKDNENIDFTGLNIYSGWYENLNQGATEEGAETIGKRLDSTINKMKNSLGIEGKVILSEYGAGANVNQHADMNENFIWKSSDTSGDFHPEEYQSFIHEAMIKAIEENDDILASFAWAMFDFSSYRNEGDQERLNDKGLVTYDRQIKKDAFYLYKAIWNKEDKFVYLTSRRYTERKNDVTDIKVYSNCENVTLTVNGVDYGKGTKQQDGVFVWEGVKLENNNEIIATSVENGEIYTDKITCTAEKITGWFEENNQWYYYNEDGVMQKGWVKVDGTWYYLGISGVMQTGWIIDYDTNIWYYLNESGAMQTGWLFDKDKWYYLNGSGEMQIGWVNINGTWYYLNESGAMQTGWLLDKYDKWYYLNSSGAMQTGWVDVNGIRYYLNESGAMQTGWLFDKDKWYYLNSSGEMQIGWVNINGTWYYLNESGAMQTGWVFDGYNYYYLNELGAMQTGWLLDKDDKWYYLNSSGAMQTGWVDVNGIRYYLNKSGAMQTGWLFDEGTWYYLNGSGAMQTGWLFDKGNWYYLRDNGMMATNGIIDGWTIGENGVATKIIDN